MMTSVRPLLSVAELAEVLGKSRWTVNKYINDGRFPFEVLTDLGVRQVRRTDVEAFLHLPEGALIDDLERVASHVTQAAS